MLSNMQFKRDNRIQITPALMKFSIYRKGCHSVWCIPLRLRFKHWTKWYDRSRSRQVYKTLISSLNKQVFF